MDSDDSDLEKSEYGESYKLRRQGKARGTEIAENQEDEDEDEDDVGGYLDGIGIRRRASVSTVQSYQLYTPDEERAVVRKFDRKLVLFVALLYMLSFLDRSSNSFPSSLLTESNYIQILEMRELLGWT
jgi:hypothetical protein